MPGEARAVREPCVLPAAFLTLLDPSPQATPGEHWLAPAKAVSPAPAVEWTLTGRDCDLEAAIARCDACGRPGLRYQFEICHHDGRHAHRWACIGCAIAATGGRNADGVPIDLHVRRHAMTRQHRLREVRRAVEQIKAEHARGGIVDLRTRRSDQMLRLFDQLLQTDDHFMAFYAGLREAHTGSGILSVKQTCVLLWRLKAHDITFDPRLFSVVRLTGHDRTAVCKLKPFQLDELSSVLTAGQRELLDMLRR